MHTKCRWPSELSKSQTFRVHKLTRAERWAKAIAIDEHEMITVFHAASKVVKPWPPCFCMKDGWPSTLKDSGIVMLAKDLQPSKAPSPMAVTDSLQSDDCQRIGTCEGRVPNERHRLRDCDACQRTATFKGSRPNSRPNSRHWGMVTLAKDFQSAKAKSWMAFTDWGIVTFTELRLVVLLKDLQAQKAHIPMSVTDSGIVMLSKEMQS